MDRYRKFDHIFREYYTRLYYHAYSYVQHPDNARDAVNDTFEILWKNFSVHADHPQLGAYLYSIVRHKCVDLLRRQAIHERYVNHRKQAAAVTEEYDYTDYDTRIELLRQQIEALPPQTRKAFVLCHIEGCSYLETARQLGVSVNTVKTFLSRARKILREVYEQGKKGTKE